MGVTVAAMTHDRVHLNLDFSEQYDVKYLLLSDKNGRMANAFRIRNKEMPRGHRYYGIARPGVMYIDASGHIRAKMAVRGYKERPSFQNVYAMLVNAIEIPPPPKAVATPKNELSTAP